MESTVKEKSIFELKGVEKLNYARRQLVASFSSKDTTMTKYWLDTIRNINLTIGDDAMNPELGRALNRLGIAIESDNQTSISYWNEVIDTMVEGIQSHRIEEPSDIQNDHVSLQDIKRDEHPKMTSKEEQLIYAREQFKIAIDASDEETANFWQNVIEDVTKEISAKEDSQNNQMITIHPQAKELTQLYESFVQASTRGETLIAEKYAQNIKDILARQPLTVLPSIWESYTEEERLKFMNLKAIETDILGQKEEHEYWLSYIKRLTLEPRP